MRPEITRRDLLRSLGATVAAAAVPFEALQSGVTGFVPDVEIALRAAPDEVRVLSGPLTRVWRFTGEVVKGPAAALQVIPDSYLGPTLRLKRGQKVRIRFSNRLPDPSIVHWHGLDVPQEVRRPSASGGPRGRRVRCTNSRSRIERARTGITRIHTCRRDARSTGAWRGC